MVKLEWISFGFYLLESAEGENESEEQCRVHTCSLGNVPFSMCCFSRSLQFVYKQFMYALNPTRLLLKNCKNRLLTLRNFLSNRPRRLQSWVITKFLTLSLVLYFYILQKFKGDIIHTPIYLLNITLFPESLVMFCLREVWMLREQTFTI